MRLGLIVVALAMAWSVPAWAQSSITLDASGGNPIVEATINNRPVRLEVDLRFPDALAMSRAAAERLRVWRAPVVGVRIGVDGSEATISGRIARPRLKFGDESSRAFAGVFPAPVSRRADGLIGPGALPYDVITVSLRPELEGSRDIVFQLEDPDVWRTSAIVGGEDVRIFFHVGDRESVLNRTATRMFDAAGAIPSAGELVNNEMILGLHTMMQPVTTDLSLQGIAIAPALARTNAPLLGATEEDAVVVNAQADDPPPPIISVGAEALSRCVSIRVDRRARTLTLRCA